VTLEQVAADFGIHPMTLSKWMRTADVDERVKPMDRSSSLGIAQ
jgi:transposase